eukprot:TRINITY_DN17164_c0_g1_i1.p1 TRINITY_DN17164_c0_g1~~TRINITY_DN17164_c0_g1_i1.p1  ORF type:complete len:680 (-),score=227.65 TRINITY_DN17164_c0_g1_i1:69-2108(-)
MDPVDVLRGIIQDVVVKASLTPKKVGAGAAVVAGLWVLKNYSDAQLRTEIRKEREEAKLKLDRDAKDGVKSEKPSSKKATVNKEFFTKFKKFIPILVPSVASKEMFDLVAIGLILLARTWLDFWMIANNAQILGTLPRRDYKSFIKYVAEFGFMQIPISGVNNLLKYFISRLSLHFRERLTSHMHKKYMSGFTFYAASNLDSRTNNIDQLLTQDIEKFSTSLSNLYSNVTKPLLDMILFFVKLVLQFGWKGPSSMLGYFLVAGAVMTRLRVPFGKYTSIQAKHEGDFRHVHSRLITHSEEVAFYGGRERELTLMNNSFKRLTTHINKYLHFRLVLGLFDSMITKYTATLLGYFLVTAPIFDPKNDARYSSKLGGDPKNIMEDYTRYMRLLIAMVEAVGRLIDAGRELSHFAGYTDRVALLSDVLDDLNKGKFERTIVSENKGKFGTPKGTVVIRDSDQPIIRFDQVPIVTPNGDVLVPSLSFEVKSGMNCLISGPNGCGKSSLFRLLGGLWPIYDGTITRPNEKNLFYVPQKPYLALGSLRDQVIYPDTHDMMKAKGKTDEDLIKLMAIVRLEYVVTREGGWDSVADWADVLSGGEKQRVAMARLFYHEPQFAILDECTSAVSMDVEGSMYAHAKTAGITLFTVSHRSSLWKFHEYILKFDGRGSFEFRKLEESEYPKE